MKTYKLLFTMIFCGLIITTTFIGCDKKDDPDPEPTGVISFSPSDSEDDILEAFINVKADDVIEFAAGTYNFTRTLNIEGVDNFKIKGAGLDQTILSFAGQTVGAEGVKITNSNNFVLANLTVQDTEGDAIKTRDCAHIGFYNVGTVWTGEASEENGAYGLYPVLCEHIMIDGCLAKGASDAGIYVGQSDQVIVKNCTAEDNVAGIEIENTTNADVFDNTAIGNTGGILIFDLPGLTKAGAKCRVFNNRIEQNDHENFAPKGNIVGEVPAGTGMLLLACKQVEIFENTFINNNVMGIGITNYLLIESVSDAVELNDQDYDTNPGEIFIYNNSFTRKNIPPSTIVTYMGGVFSLLFDGAEGNPDIGFDGIDPDPAFADQYRICIQNNGDAKYIDLDLGNFPGGNPSEDITVRDCSIERLPAIVVDAPTL